MSETVDVLAGRAYADLISEQLQEERTRKTSLEQRGLAVITTSGVLVSVLFGVTANVIGENRLPIVGKVFVILSLVLFVGACLMGIATNAPREYVEVEPEGLRKLLDPERWRSSIEVGIRRSAEARIGIYQSARQITNAKARFLTWGILCEVFAVVSLAVAVGAVILS